VLATDTHTLSWQVRHALEPADPDALTVTVVSIVEPWVTPVRVAVVRVAVRETWAAKVLVADEVPAVSAAAPANAKTAIILLNAITFILTEIFRINTAIKLPRQWPDSGQVLLDS
jgi:hypothetical protein